MPKIVLFVLCVSIISIFGGISIYNFQKLNEIENRLPITLSPTINTSSEKLITTLNEDSQCGADCQEFIKNEVAHALSQQTPAPTVNTQSQSTTKQTTYVPLSGPVSTTSTDWVDVPGSDVTIDVADYGKSPSITWDASIKIANANGLVYARLYDDTHDIVVVGSEINTDKSTYTQVTSGALNFWSGKNNYKVQIKSQTSQEATFGNGRIKIVY